MPVESASTVVYRRQTQIRPVDREIAGLAGRQYGVVSRAQLVDMELSESAIERRIRAGRLHPLHPGVYAVGHTVLSREGRWLAAVLRAGRDAILSHRSAAAFWGIVRGGVDRPIEITAPRSTRSSGILRRHCGFLASDEITIKRRIPVTTLPRTILDIAAMLPVEALEGAIREAEYHHRLRLRDLDTLLARYSGRRGTATLRTCLGRLDGGPRGRVRSKLENRFASLLASIDLPSPQLNAVLELDGGWVEADCLWREQRVIVELDGGKAHRTRSAFESDRERDRRLQAAGWRVIRVTWRQLGEPDALVRDLRRILADESALTAA